MHRQGVECGHAAGAELPLSDVMELGDRRTGVRGCIVFVRKAVEGYRSPRRCRDRG